MMLSPSIRYVAAVLLVAMIVWSAQPPQACAQTMEEGGGNENGSGEEMTATSHSNSSDLSENILVGVLIVVVALLVILGIQSDINRRADTRARQRLALEAPNLEAGSTRPALLELHVDHPGVGLQLQF